MTRGGILGGTVGEISPFYPYSVSPTRSAIDCPAPILNDSAAPCNTLENMATSTALGRTQPSQAAICGVIGGGISSKWCVGGGIVMLTDTAIRKSAKGAKPYKLFDQGGLFVYVSTTGAKSFRLKYRFGGKEKLLTIGLYPVVTLAAARDYAITAKRLLMDGIDPSEHEPEQARAESFETVAREWHTLQSARWSPVHAADTLAAIERDLFPALGGAMVDAVTVPQMLAVLRSIEERGAIETAHRQRQRCEAIFAYAISTARATTNPAMQIKGALAPINKTGHQPAVVTLDEARHVYATVSVHAAQPETTTAHKLLALTAVRPGDVLGAQWVEFEGLDTAAPIWRIPATRMKGSLTRKAERGAVHVVPLSPEAVAVIESMRPLSGAFDLVFPSPRKSDRQLSGNALGYLVQRAGFSGRHVPHGWRASFSTIMNERHPADRAIIDLMLAHVSDGVEAAYNRAQHMPRRRELACEWARILTE